MHLVPAAAVRLMKWRVFVSGFLVPQAKVPGYQINPDTTKTGVTKVGFLWASFGTRSGSLNCLSRSQCVSKRRNQKNQNQKKQNQKKHSFRTLPFVYISNVILEEHWNNGFFDFFGFFGFGVFVFFGFVFFVFFGLGFIGLLKERG